MTNSLVDISTTPRSRSIAEIQEVQVTKPDEVTLTNKDKKELEALIVEVRTLNDLQNSSKAKYEARRKFLLKEMDRLGKDKHSFIVKTELNGVLDELPYDAVVGSPTSQEIDPVKMKSMIDEKDFMALVSISQEAAGKLVGTSVIQKCLRDKIGNRNVTVTAKKQK